ncbi:helix-turn-helix domain-containing protein [Microbacterium sp. 13-71-7]|jgi:excisionase family DNA binding protein|uniref:helix-turn-helix domain-containing protein n=1 Tax=Microbacterium sp. 13-71-7 TaxID=1970399 RepID=UPI000BC95A54|nr:helix-turn-helix domain-containing protein [Microbacterium sp. 13-71-7]OZB84379.1 MAG: hypothetical protein B7X32_07380 [Microbacterium sp. 13-71-7]
MTVTAHEPLRVRSAGAKAIAASSERGELIDVAEAAGILGVSTRSVRRYIAEGYLPARRFGPKLIRIRRSDLEVMGENVIRAS